MGTDWLARARGVFPGGGINVLRVPPEKQFVVARAEGAKIWDVAGRDYVDVVLGSGPLILGHSPKVVQEALVRQLRRGTTYYNVSRPTVRLAELILEAFPWHGRVRFTSGGSDATYFALRLARAATGRNRVLKFEGAFHGFHDASMMSLSPTDAPRFPRGTPSSAGVSEGTGADVLVAPFNDLEATRRIVEEHRSELAAVIVEPIQRDISPRPGFLAGLRQLADETGALLIFDEVVTGFRLRYGGVDALYDVYPDLTCLGKIVGGGLPLAAVVGPEDMMNLCAPDDDAMPVYFSGTLSGNPLSAAAGRATLRALQEEGVYERLHEIGGRVRQGISDAARDAGVPVQVTGAGPMFHLHFTEREIVDYRDSLAADRERLRRTHLALLERGVFVNPGAKSYLSTAHTDGDVERIVAAFHEAISTV